MTTRVPVPRDRDNDYTREAADARRAFVRERTGVDLEHVGSCSFDPGALGPRRRTATVQRDAARCRGRDVRDRCGRG
jgi:hypothetical protein